MNLKGLEHEIVPVSLAPGVAEHRGDAYRAKNPQMLVPFLEDGDFSIGQSMAMLEYLEEAYPEVSLLPTENPLRSQVRAVCNMVACDMHPLMNLRVLNFVRENYNADPAAEWYHHWIATGFSALEEFVSDGPYFFGENITLADCVLVPQIYNARRFKIPLDDYPKLVAVADRCNELGAFIDAAPENQSDAD